MAKMNVFKVELLIITDEVSDPEELKDIIEHTKYPNRWNVFSKTTKPSRVDGNSVTLAQNASSSSVGV